MSWAGRRKFLIVAIIGATLAAIVAVTLIATLYKAPTCTDNKQDGTEQGVDCGGPCTYLCSTQVTAASVKFVRPVSPTPGRTDVIAYIDNPNPSAAAKAAKFTISLYGPDGVLVAQQKDSTDLPPRSTTPIYVPDFFSGFQTVAHAFLTFDDGQPQWKTYQDTRDVPSVENYQLLNASTTPSITATISNSAPTPFFDVKVIATVFGADGNVVAASQTVIPQIKGQSTAVATFTWNAPFAQEVARVDITPLIPL